MNFARNGFLFVVLYFLVVIPTYILPYTGSNSSVAAAVSAAVAGGVLPQTWMHIGCLLSLVLLTWLRGALGGKPYVAIFPLLAGIADMVPGFSLIPLLPSLFHVVGLVLGLRCVPSIAESSDASALASHISAGRRRTLIAGGVLAVFGAVALIASISVVGRLEPQSRRSSKSTDTQVQVQKPPILAPTLAQPQQQARSSETGQAAGTSRLPQLDQPTTPTEGGASLDPALALSSTGVDPAAVAITTGGFSGLKVGHSLSDGKTFFGRDLIDEKYCGETNPNWAIYSPKGLSGILLGINGGRIVAFWVSNGSYQTKSGLRVGDSEARLLELFGGDPTLERKTFYVESGAYHQIEYLLGKQGSTSMRIQVKAGRVTDLIFGSSREIWRFGVPC